MAKRNVVRNEKEKVLEPRNFHSEIKKHTNKINADTTEVFITSIITLF